tara:strand:+ start:627 stop:1583 length:957 start_codon:yes stop_codon:yes gene_type:complete
MENVNSIKSKVLSSFSLLLKSKIENFVIKDKSAFITLNAESASQAKKLEQLKIECEEKVKIINFFDNVYVSFTIIERKFKKIIAISSCKGGVGKSTIASNLALSLNNLGFKTGILDADIYGPSIPKIFKLNKKPEIDEKKKIIPLNYQGIEIISIGFMIDEKKPVIWRGPMIQTALMQLVNEVKWSNLDCLIIDLPPGTGDPHLTLMQKLKITHGIVVTTNEEIALADTRKGINMLIKLNVPISGVVENMSYLKCNNCEEKHFIFGKNGVENLCKEFNLKLLAKIPIMIGDDKNIFEETDKDLVNEYKNLTKNLTDLL